jgi:hypothetical protein
MTEQAELENGYSEFYSVPISLLCTGGGIKVWSENSEIETQQDPTCKTDPESHFELIYNRMMVIGRQQGGRLCYLHPSYRPTQICGGKTVLVMNDKKTNMSAAGISRL